MQERRKFPRYNVKLHERLLVSMNFGENKWRSVQVRNISLGGMKVSGRFPAEIVKQYNLVHTRFLDVAKRRNTKEDIPVYIDAILKWIKLMPQVHLNSDIGVEFLLHNTDEQTIVQNLIQGLTLY